MIVRNSVFERFTDRSRRVVVLAQEAARTLGHTHIGTEHVLLGLVQEGDGVAAKALDSFGITLEKATQQVEQEIGRGEGTPPGHIPLTPRAKRVLELARREALKLGHTYVGTEHLLLALIRQGADESPQYEGVGVTVLVDLGVELSALRQHILSVLSGAPASQAPAHEAEPQQPSIAAMELRGRVMLAVRGASTDQLQAILDLLNK